MSRQAFLQLRILESCRAAAVPAGLFLCPTHTKAHTDRQRQKQMSIGARSQFLDPKSCSHHS